MIGYLFFSAAIFSLLNRDLTARNRRVLIIIFSAALAVSAYSLSFIYVFFVVSLFIALRIKGKREQLLNLSLVITILAIVFSWYIFVSAPPLNKLQFVINNIFNRFTQDVFSSQARLEPQYALLSPTVQTTFVGLFHKILIYLTDGFIVVGAAVIVLKPKTTRVSPEFRWLAIIGLLILTMVLVVPNVAPSINFTRFYRAAMIFLAPLFVVGGLYLLDFFKKIRVPSRIMSSKVTYRSFEFLILAVILATFFLFRVGFANYISGGYPISYSLSFSDMKMSRMDTIIQELDVYSAKWLEAKGENNKLIYVGGEIRPIICYTNFNRDSLYFLTNTTKAESDSYIYLSTANIISGLAGSSSEDVTFLFNASDLSPVLAQSDKIYSNGQSEDYYVP
jgi:uncharacterized membrane protein